MKKETTNAISHEAIAKKAYEFYLARGKTDGHAQEDWSRAETELTGKIVGKNEKQKAPPRENSKRAVLQSKSQSH